MNVDFKALISEAPNPYVLLDSDFQIVWMNAAYLKVTMRQQAELVGRGMFDAFPSDPNSDSHRKLRGSLDRVLATGKTDELALIRYDIPRADGSLETRYWSATHTPLLDADGNVEFILQHTVDVTELHALRALRNAQGVVERAEAVQAKNASLAEETRRLQALLDQAPGFVAVLSGPSHIFQMANVAYRSLVGGRDVIGKSLAEALPEVLEQGFDRLLDEVRSTRTAYVGKRHKVLLQNSAGGPPEERYLDFIYQPILSSDEVSGIFIQGHDVSEQVDAEDQQKLLINELNHRVKNTLAIVQSLAAQSFRQVGDGNPALSVFTARLAALSAAHGLLTRSNWEASQLEDVIRSSLAATAGANLERCTISGPPLLVPPQMTTSVAMLVHELSTNAIKYGSLSGTGGRVTIRWTVTGIDGRRQLTFDWKESGGPLVTNPTRKGFGTRLISRGIASDRNPQVTLEFNPDGLLCRIVALLPEGPA